MMVGVLKETMHSERRVALVPTVIASLTKANLQVIVESGAGDQAGFPDADYQSRGATIASNSAEVVAKAQILCSILINPALDYRAEQTVIGLADPLGNPLAAATLAATGVRSFALELLPRITRAQSMDVLSSQATVAGHKAVLLAADHLPRLTMMMMTAAGTVRAAKAFVIGAGVAGLQAIATARRLGAVVFAYDVRAAVKEQVESLGARFVQMELQSAEGAG